MKYHLARGDQQLGTFNDLDVSAGLRDGSFLPGDLCWTEGMSGWKRLDEHLREISPEPEALEASPGLAELRDEVRRDHESDLEQPPLASLGRRIAAFVIDWALILIPMMIMVLSLMDAEFQSVILARRADPEAVVEALQLQIEKQAAAGNEVLPMMSLVIMALMLGNSILLTVRGQTSGKWFMGIQVVRFGDGSRAGFVKAVLLRGVLFVLLGNLRAIGPVLFMVDYWMALREDRRCLHDIVADTKVVRLRA